MVRAMFRGRLFRCQRIIDSWLPGCRWDRLPVPDTRPYEKLEIDLESAALPAVHGGDDTLKFKSRLTSAEKTHSSPNGDNESQLDVHTRSNCQNCPNAHIVKHGVNYLGHLVFA